MQVFQFFIAALVAVCIGVGVLYLSRAPMPQQAVPVADAAMASESGRSSAVPGAMSPSVESRLDRLEAAIEKLEAAVREGASRQPIGTELSDERLAAAIEKYIQAHPELGRGAATATDEAGRAKRAFQQILAATGVEDVEKMWDELRENGGLDDVLALFEDHAKNLPNDPEAQLQLGYAYLQRLRNMTPGVESGKMAVAADESFDRTLTLDSRNWDARYVKSMSLSFWPAAFGKQKEAIDHLKILRDQQEGEPSQKKFAQTYVLLGNLYSQQGKADEAKEAWQAGIERFPDNEQLKKQLGK